MDKDIIINYEELFKDDESNKNDKKLPDQTNKSVLTIVLYVALVYLLLAQLIVYPFLTIKDSAYLVLEQATLRNADNYLYVINEDDLIEFNDEFNINESYIYIKEGVAYITYYDEIINDRNNFVLKIPDIISGNRIYFSDNIEPDLEEDKVIINYANNLSIEIENPNRDVIENQFTFSQQSILITVSYLIVAVALFIPNYNKIKFDYSLIQKHSKEKPFVTNMIQSALLLIAVSMGIGIITQLVGTIFNFSSISANQESINMLMNSKYAILTLITVTFIGPLVEELVFRGAFFNLIKNPKIAIIVSSITFGLIHIRTEIINLSSGFDFITIMQILVFSLQYIGMGAFLGYLYEKNNRNIVFIYGVHGLYNLLVSILQFV